MTRFEPFKDLIISLPTAEQEFYAKQSTWIPMIADNPELHLWQQHLVGGTVHVKRSHLYDCDATAPNGILHVLIWGYPSGGRGANIQKCIANISDISVALTQLKHIEIPTLGDLINFSNACKHINGLGMSTWSKLLHFNHISFDGYESNIYDKVIKDVISLRRIDLSEYIDNSIRNTDVREYMAYLKFLTDHASKIGAKSVQIELFLYLIARRFDIELNTQ